MIALLGSTLLASLLGSLHCAGMCGGLVTLVSRKDGHSALTAGAYHLSRGAAYLVLGALAGTLGAALNGAGEWAGLSHVAAVVAGSSMIVWALWRLARLFFARGSEATLKRDLRAPRASFASLVYARLLRLTTSGRSGVRGAMLHGALLGVASGLLPCGWLYAFVLTSAGSGSLLAGALVMSAFWVGTVPVLVGLGMLVGRLDHALRRRLPLLSAAVVLALGISTVYARATLELPKTAAEQAPACH